MTTRSALLAIAAMLAMAVLVAGAAAGQSPSPSAPPAGECVEPEASAEPVEPEILSMPEEFRIALFNGVWDGIRDFYVDPDVKDLDWQAIGDEYAPLVISTENAHEVYELLQEMVGLLEDPFTNYFSPEDLGDPATIDPTYAGIGALLDTSLSDADGEGLRILYVFEGSSAADAGIAPRDRIVGVNGEACARIVDIRGPEGTDVTLTVVSPGEDPRDITLERRRIEPRILPEARRLEADPSVGYLRVLALSGQWAVDGIEQALTRFTRGEPIEGLVLDLRASDQGAPGVMLGTLRTFVSGEVGAFHSRVGEEPIQVEPDDLADDYAAIPIVVLVDDQTEADAEQLAAILQDQGRAKVIGQQTSGQTHGANRVDFPDGSLLQIVSFGFQLPDGRTLEGLGVTPDISIDDDWLAYAEAEDPYLVAALEVIEEARAAPSPSPSAGPSAAPSPSAGPSAAPSPSAAASPAG